MAMEDYYEVFYLQTYSKIPTGLPPPFDYEWAFGDGPDFMGAYIQDTSPQLMQASAMGYRATGRFVCDPSIPIRDGDVVRRESDNAYIKIKGQPKVSPPQAESQIKTFIGEITEVDE